MITSSGKVLQIHGKRLCLKCNRMTDHTCFYMKYRKSPTNDDAIQKEERWVCDNCHTALQIDYRTGGNPRYYFGDQRLLLVPDEMRKCVAFAVFRGSGGVKLAGTVFFVGVEVAEFGLDAHFAVTAKHVIDGIRKKSIDGKVHLRMNFKEEPTSLITCDIEQWRFHPSDSSVDVAVMPFRLSEKFDHLLYPVRSFVTEELIEEERIGLGDEVFLVGLFYGHVGTKRNIPIVRAGNIAAMPEEPVDTDIGSIEAYLVEARSIGGLSGSPVFVHLGLIRPNKEGKLMGFTGTHSGRFYLLGLMHGHWDRPVSEADTIVEDDARHETVNMGIAVVIPAKKILEVIHQPDWDAELQKQIDELRRQSLPKLDKK